MTVCVGAHVGIHLHSFLSILFSNAMRITGLS